MVSRGRETADPSVVASSDRVTVLSPSLTGPAMWTHSAPGAPVVTRVTLEETQKTLSALAAQVASDGRPVLVSRGRGRRAVAIVPAAELGALRAAAEDDEPLTAADWRAIRAGEKAIARGDFVTLEELDAKAR